MKLLDRCIQQEVGKNGKKSKAFVGLVCFLEDLGKRESESGLCYSNTRSVDVEY